jgi:anti-sigma B factor antagonist
VVVSHEHSGDTWRVRVSGDVDLATARALEHQLDVAFDSGAARVDVDLHDARFWDGRAFRVLARAGERADHDGTRLTLVGVSATLRRVLEVTEVGGGLVADDEIA